MTHLIFSLTNRTIVAMSLLHLAAIAGPEVRPAESGRTSIIPKPAQIRLLAGAFTLSPATVVVTPPRDQVLLQLGKTLAGNILEFSGVEMRVIDGSPSEKGAISLLLDESLKDLGAEGYALTVNDRGMSLRSAETAGIFRGIQTIRQLLPAGTLDNAGSPRKVSIPCVEIRDRPRFRWRGMLLDCGRHFMSKEFIKRTIDWLAYYKLNILHWHLTEDQGWRIEIRKYPLLTKVGAWRTNEDGTVYGGFYTQEDIREVVSYAASRHVTVVPEIEMPGHSVAALAAYPQFSCTGGPFLVQTQWGVHRDVYCAGKESTFGFLQDILTEVMELFPSTYIHIGGDEVPKDRWKTCPDCQQRIRAEGLKDENELQSYFIRRIGKFLQSHNRRLIGWDEVLEGGLAPDATVQSWRGMDGAVAAVRAGHDAIASPSNHTYYSQGIRSLDLQRAYSFEPVPEGLSPEESPRILGGECAMWTEDAPQETVEGKLFPRLLALAEVLWSPAGLRVYPEFYARVQDHFTRLDRLNIKYGPVGASPIAIVPALESSRKAFSVTVLPAGDSLDIRYTLNGTEPSMSSPRYVSPFVIESSGPVKASVFASGRQYGDMVESRVALHEAIGREVRYRTGYSPNYTGGGPTGLTDGFRGTADFHDGRWQGFEQEDFEGVVDLGSPTRLLGVTVGFLQNANSWIFLPPEVILAVSANGTDFHEVDRVKTDISPRKEGAITKDYRLDCHGAEGRFVRVTAKNLGLCPPWHAGAGGKAWVFVDEIVINERQSASPAQGSRSLPSPRGYVCHEIRVPISVDGRLDEAVWRAVPWTDDFQDIQGDPLPKPRFRSRAKMLWDSTYFYIAAELEEPDVWATLTKRDTVIYYDNDFEVFIDPNGDNHEYYEFEMNAHNTVWDLFLPMPYKDLGKPDEAWDIEGLKTGVHVRGTLNNPADRDSAWTVEIAMPWKALGEYAHCPAPPHAGDQWRVNFSRVEWKIRVFDGRYEKIKGIPEDNWVWSPQGVINMHCPERWGYVQFAGPRAGSVAFVPDPSWPAREFLHRIYYRQKELHDGKEAYAFTLEELGLSASGLDPHLKSPEVRRAPEGYVASVVLQLSNGTRQRWFIRQDSRIWKEDLQ